MPKVTVLPHHPSFALLLFITAKIFVAPLTSDRVKYKKLILTSRWFYFSAFGTAPGSWICFTM